MYEILRLINEMSPYLLLGFLVAGLLHAFVPGSLYSRYLSGGGSTLGAARRTLRHSAAAVLLRG